MASPTSLRPPPSPLAGPAPEVVLPWLVRLRWAAVSGQAFTFLGVSVFLELALPYAALLTLLGITVASNLALVWLIETRLAPVAWLGPAVLTLDTLLFTGLLYLCGGAHNPFALLYVVHVAMAAVALSLRWTWFMALLSAACYGGLFLGSLPLEQAGGIPLAPSLYRYGTWFSVTLVALVIAYFISQMTRALRQREVQLGQLGALAARNERLASLTTLAAGAAHELGTPLGTIAVVAKELERATGHDPEVAEDARLIRSQVDRCRAILDRMSADAEKSTAAAEEIAPSELLQDLRLELAEAAPRLRLSAHEHLGMLKFPRQDVLQALVPLLKNALDASPPQAEVELTVERRDKLLLFTVQDQGSGMTPEVAARAGDPFYTTKPPGRGTGLGLHLVRLLAERLGGELQLESHAGTGTTAVLRFPEAHPGDGTGAAADPE